MRGSLTDREKASGLWLPGFTPGEHCTQGCHFIKGELKELPPIRDEEFPFVCEECLPKVKIGAVRSKAAKRAAGKRKEIYKKRGYIRKPKSAVEVQVGLLFYAEDGMERYRVWNTRWFNDQFEIMTQEEFDTLRTTCIRFSIPLVEQED